MSSEERIIELEKRIEILEKAENKRIIKRKFKIAYEVIKILIILGLLLFGYIYINNKIIKPYNEKMDYINDKVNTVENFVEDKFSSIKNIFK